MCSTLLLHVAQLFYEHAPELNHKLWRYKQWSHHARRLVESKLTCKVCCGAISTGKTWSADDDHLGQIINYEDNSNGYIVHGGWGRANSYAKCVVVQFWLARLGRLGQSDCLIKLNMMINFVGFYHPLQYLTTKGVHSKALWPFGPGAKLGLNLYL